MKTPSETSKIKIQPSSIVNQIAERVAFEGQSSALFRVEFALMPV